MSKAFRFLVVLVALGAISAAFRQDDNKGEQSNTVNLDTTIYNSLRDVINRGADVYNNDDHAGCYRIFEGGLVAVKPLLAHRPDLQKVISNALVSAEADPVVWRRAFTLRAALDKIRAELNPKKGKNGKLPPPQEKDKELKEKDKDKEQKDKDKDKDKDEKKEAAYKSAMTRAEAAMDAKKYADAIKAYDEALKAKPGDATATNGRKAAVKAQQDDKKKEDDLSAERLPPPLKEENKQGEKDV